MWCYKRREILGGQPASRRPRSVRLGNCRKQVLLAAFERALPALVTALAEGQRVV